MRAMDGTRSGQRNVPFFSVSPFLGPLACSSVGGWGVGRILEEPRHIAFVKQTMERLWEEAFDAASGALEHDVFRGRAKIRADLDDYALFGIKLLSPNDATKELVWRDCTATIATAMRRRFLRGNIIVTTQALNEFLHAPPDYGDPLALQHIGGSGAGIASARVGFTTRPALRLD